MADKIAVSAALDRLAARTEATWEADAQMVVDYFIHLKSEGVFSGEASVSYTSENTSITGHVPGHGNVTTDSAPETKKVGGSFGEAKERIGKFRVWKYVPGIIAFHRYEFSELNTRGSRNAPETFWIGYALNDRKALYLGTPHPKVLRIFFLSIVYRVDVEKIFSRS